MYLSAERLALANQTIQETFEQSSVAWQAIPQWNTGDIGQTRVRSDITSLEQPVPPDVANPPNTLPLGGDPADIESYTVPFYVSLAQLTSPTADVLLSAVIARAVFLARLVDKELVVKLLADPQPTPEDVPKDTDANDLLSVLIDARVAAEQYGYRAPSCVLTDAVGLKALGRFEGGYSVLAGLLDAANINSVYRVEKLELAGGVAPAADTGRILLLGRRQLIPAGGAPSASPGEEPVDLAVSVPPSLEIVGETSTGLIELAVRTRLAIRVKDKYGVIGVETP